MLFILISGIQRGWGGGGRTLGTWLFLNCPSTERKVPAGIIAEKPEAFVGLAVPPSGPGSKD